LVPGSWFVVRVLGSWCGVPLQADDEPTTDQEPSTAPRTKNEEPRADKDLVPEEIESPRLSVSRDSATPAAPATAGRRSPSQRVLWLLAFACCLAGLSIGTPSRVTDPVPVIAAATEPEPPPSGVSPAEASEPTRQSLEGAPWASLIARIVNFAVLVGVLVYLLKSPMAAYLKRRSAQIRTELVKAAEMREAAREQIEEVDRRLAALPAEIEALKERGAREIAAEEARIREQAAAERERLLEYARREIERHLTVAERELLHHAADLAIQIASQRITRAITSDDQVRLVDRYLAQVGKAATM